MSAKDRKFNIFSILSKTNRQDFSFLSELSAEDQRSIHPYVLMRWRTGTKDGVDCLIMNELVNKYVFNLHQHKELHWKLLCVFPSRSSRFQWVHAPSAKNQTKYVESVKLLCKHYNYTISQALEAVKVVDLEYMIDLAEMYAYDDSELTRLYKEWGEKYNRPKGKRSRGVEVFKEVIEDEEQESVISDNEMNHLVEF